MFLLSGSPIQGLNKSDQCLHIRIREFLTETWHLAFDAVLHNRRDAGFGFVEPGEVRSFLGAARVVTVTMRAVHQE